jgi:hypothetical protein
MPLTKLGIALGELKLDLDVPEDVALFGVPRGKIDLTGTSLRPIADRSSRSRR